MKVLAVALFSLVGFVAAAPTPHGDTNVKDDAVTVDAISEALYSGWAITKRDAKEAKEDAVTVDAISEALYSGWAITKRDDEE